MIAADHVMEPFLGERAMYTHGITFGGHPVQCAIALKNIEIMKRERIVENVRDNGAAFRATLEQLLELPIVGDLRGTGYFYALELVKDKETRDDVLDEECETLLRGFLSPRLFEKGLICRADDRGDPVIQISPPLIATQKEFDEIAGTLGEVLDGGMAEDRVVDVRLSNLTKRFDDVVAVDDLSLEIERGRFFALLGPSGCGKTTTLRMIGGFEEPTRAGSSSATATSRPCRRTSATSTPSSSRTRSSRI